MDPRLVLYTISIFHNKSVLFIRHEVVRVMKEPLVKRRGRSSRKECRIGRK